MKCGRTEPAETTLAEFLEVELVLGIPGEVLLARDPSDESSFESRATLDNLADFILDMRHWLRCQL